MSAADIKDKARKKYTLPLGKRVLSMKALQYSKIELS